MSINYEGYERDWWDEVGITADAVKTGIDQLVQETFGTGGIPAAQQQAIADAAKLHYEAQEAMKLAAKA